MTDPQQDAGLLAVLIERLESSACREHWSSRTRWIAGKASMNSILPSFRISLPTRAKLKPLIERHPEHQELVGKLFGLYREITEKALANEKAG